jgi:hypothetical protein
LSIIKESFFFAPHASPANAATMIKDDISSLRFLTDTNGCIASDEVTPIYFWDPDTSNNLKNQKAPHAHTIIFSEIQLITYCATYLITGRYSSSMKPYFYVELVQDCKGQEKVFGISRLYVGFRMYYEQVKRYFDLSRSEQVKAKIFEEEFVQYQERLTNKILALLWVDAMTGIRKRYNACSVSCSFLSRSIFLFFNWLSARVVKLNKILTLFTNSIVESLPEKILSKRTEGARIKPEVVKFVEGI